MPKTIDSLQIEIKASATQAEKAIDSLVSKLGSLQKSVNGASFDKFTKSTQAISSESKKLSISLSNIGNRTKLMARHVGNATNTFKLSKSVMSMFSNSLKKVEKSADSTGNVLDKLASKVGKFYSRIYTFQRIGNSLWGSIKSSMDYIEVLNYFEASFGQVADRAVDKWTQAGYDSAKSYYDSFKERALQETKKLTGFMMTNDGTLESTGSKSLGLNPQETLQYQAQFAQMASSMGATSEQALKLSNALTKIGADLASVKNLDFAQVWGDMASGLVGMSRTLDKYGVNIRNANMQTKLAELGIDATVSSLSQADKALLRTIILLDSTKYAWGDLADTLNQPANQLRLITSNFKNLCRMIGNLFLPLVAKVLPYVNALVIALQRLVTLIGKFFGINLKSITSSVGGGGGEAMSDLLDETDDLGESLDDASGKAKKLKQNLMGVDELNIINEDQDSGGASGLGGGIGGLLDGAFEDALADYMDAWNKAFENLDNRAQELADKIGEFFSKLFSPIAKGWEIEGENVIESWKRAIKSLGDLLKSIGSDFMEVWLEPETVRIFENLFHVLADIGQVVEALTTNFRKAWDEGDRGKAIFQAIRDIAVELSESVRRIADYTVKWAQSLNFAPALEQIKRLLESLADVSKYVFGVFEHGYENFLIFAKYIIEDALPRIIAICKDLVDKIDWERLSAQLNRISDAFLNIKTVLVEWAIKGFEKLKDLIVEFVNGEFITRLADDFEKLGSSLKNATSLGEVLNGIFDFGDGRIIGFFDIFNTIQQKLNDFLTYLNTIDPNTGETPIETIGKRLGHMINMAFLGWDAEGSGELVGKLAYSLLEIFDKAIEEVKWEVVGAKIGEFLRNIEWGKLLEKAIEIACEIIGGLFETYVGMKTKAPIETGLLTAIGGIVLTTHALKIVTKLATALTGQSNISLLKTAFEKLFKTGVSEGGTKGATTAVETVATKVSSTVKTSPKIGKLGTLFGETLAIGAGVKFGESIGNQINEALGHDTFEFNFDNAKNIFDGMGLAFEKIAQSDLPWYRKFGEYFLAGLGGGILGSLTVLGTVFKGIFDFVWNGIKDVFGIASPAKEMYPLGGYIMEGLVEGFKEKISAFWDAIKTVYGKIKEWVETEIVTPIKDTFTGLGEKISTWASETWTSITTWATETGGKIASWAEETGTKIGNWVTDTVGSVKQWYSDTKTAFGDWWDENTRKFTEWKDNTVRKVEEWYSDTKKAFGDWWDENGRKFTEWKDGVVDTLESWKTQAKEKFDRFKEEAGKSIEGFVTDTIGKFKKWKEDAQQHFEEFKERTKEKFNKWKTDVLVTVEKWGTEAKSKIEDFKNKAKGFIDDFKTNTENTFNEWKGKVIPKIEEFRDKAKDAIKNFKDKSVEKVEEFRKDSKTVIDDFTEKAQKTFEGWKDKVVDAFENLRKDGIKKCEELQTGCQQWFEAHKWNFRGIKEGLGNAFEDAISWVKRKWSGFQDWLGNIGDSVRDMFSGGAMDVRLNSGYYYNGYSTYATGGFPEDGWFRASHGELIGQFDNGQSVVANNNQIIAGIEGGVERAVSSVLAPYLADIADNTRRTADKKNSVVIDGREIVSAYDSRKARNGFSFT